MRSRVLLFLIVAATIMAIGAFLLFSQFVGGGDDTPPTDGGTDPNLLGVPLAIDNTTVYVNQNPASAVMLPGQQPQPPLLPDQQPTTEFQPVVPTATTEPVVEVQVQPTEAPPPAVAPQVTTGQGVVPGVEPIIFIDYVVAADDTLYKITTKQTTSIELMAERGIDAHDLTPGATLRLPVANPAYCSGSRPYVIRPGDTAYSIANRLGTTAQRLQELNNLNAEYSIDIADVLCVP
ncbi:MAG: LysM peptidoglycan-binding domain-containing protein [Chloroflexi bacterium]|jgi:LysM repeat protein|nr:LysM peptidoglycan-binding domain-containing protein [Chloroflexota bacterium]